MEDLEVEEMVEEAKAVEDLEVDWAEEVMVVVMVEEEREEDLVEGEMEEEMEEEETEEVGVVGKYDL